MPMTVNTREEYDKVLRVTWFVDDRSPDELTYVPGIVCKKCCHWSGYLIISMQVPLRPPVLKNVPPLLHRHQELRKSVPLLYQRELRPPKRR